MMRDFTSLKPHQVVQLAIAVEKANAKRLETFADMFESYDPSVGRIFRQLVQEEHQHRQLLERQYEQKFGPLPSELEVAEGDVRQVVEAVDVTDGEHFVFDDMTPLDALQAALKAEKRARAFYCTLATAATDPDLKRTYEELSHFETDHVEVLEERVGQLLSR